MLSACPGMTETEKEAEQVQWERRLEEFCEAREEAVEVLKSGGGDFRVRNSTSDQCQYNSLWLLKDNSISDI